METQNDPNLGKDSLMQAIRNAGGFQGAKLRHVRQENTTSGHTQKQDAKGSLRYSLEKQLSTIKAAQCGNSSDEDTSSIHASDTEWDDQKKDKVI